MQMQLLFSSLGDEFRVACIWEALLYLDSKVSWVVSAGIMVQTGRKWRAQECLEASESQLKHKLFVFAVTSSQAKDKWHQRRAEQRDGGLAAPGYMDIQHTVRACWLTKTQKDRLTCISSLLWKQDHMLKTITVTISKTKAKSKHICQQRLGNCYNLSLNLQCGCSPQRQTWNWIWRGIETSKRPDRAPLSVSSMQLLLLELTVPWEEHMEEANEKKKSKYQELVGLCRRGDWKACRKLIEVGGRGFTGWSLWKIYMLLNITGAEKTWKKEPPVGFGLGGKFHALVLLGYKPGPHQPRLVWVYLMLNHITEDILGHVIANAKKLHHKC